MVFERISRRIWATTDGQRCLVSSGPCASSPSGLERKRYLLASAKRVFEKHQQVGSSRTMPQLVEHRRCHPYGSVDRQISGVRLEIGAGDDRDGAPGRGVGDETNRAGRKWVLSTTSGR
jgi:hypothetical protein